MNQDPPKGGSFNLLKFITPIEHTKKLHQTMVFLISHRSQKPINV